MLSYVSASLGDHKDEKPLYRCPNAKHAQASTIGKIQEGFDVRSRFGHSIRHGQDPSTGTSSDAAQLQK